MALPTFRDFLSKNAYRTTKATIPASQMLSMILNGAGQRGMSYAELARILDLDTKVLRDLLNTMVSTRELVVSTSREGIKTYRQRW